MFKRRLTPSEQLLNAAAHGDLQALTAQLAAGADPNACDREGIPAVAIAASRGWAEGVAALLAAGVDPTQHVRGREPKSYRGPLLNLPAANGSLETARVLIAAGAALEATDQTGLTALMCAAYRGHEPIVKLLIEAGASLEARDQDGYTALMFSANAGWASVVRMLLDAGAKPDASATDGSTPSCSRPNMLATMSLSCFWTLGQILVWLAATDSQQLASLSKTAMKELEALDGCRRQNELAPLGRKSGGYCTVFEQLDRLR